MDFLLANKNSFLFAAGVGALVFFLLRYWSRRYLNAAPPERSETFAPRRQRESSSQQPLRDAPADIARWQAEMQDLARDLKGELDTKIAILQRLTIDAREQAERLESAIERANPARYETKQS